MQRHPYRNRNRTPRLAWAVAVVCVGFVSIAVTAHASPEAPREQSHAPTRRVVEYRVEFDVRNVNRTALSCPTDGRRHRIVGHVLAPRRALRGDAPAATVYVPGGMMTAAGAWRLTGGPPEHDMMRAMAERGHVSISIDRLGFGLSSTPNGMFNCTGGEADILGQVARHLKDGTYRMGDRRPVRFERVALAGQSYGGALVAAAAYSSEDVDGLIVIASALDQGLPADLAVDTGRNAGPTCALGGRAKHHDRRSPRGYTHLFDIDERFFVDIAPEIRSRFVSHAELEPCGTAVAAASLLSVNRLWLPSIDVPVAYVAPDHDVWTPAEHRRQFSLFSGSPDAELIWLTDSGHVPMHERAMIDGQPTYERFRSALSEWLGVRGF